MDDRFPGTRDEHGTAATRITCEPKPSRAASKIDDHPSKNDGYPGGAGVVRKEAYFKYAAVTSDELQRSRSRFDSPPQFVNGAPLAVDYPHVCHRGKIEL